MTKNNFDTIIDFGPREISACSFFKGSDTINFSKKISNENRLYNFKEEKLFQELEELILDVEKNNKEHLDQITLMIDTSKMFNISFSIFKKIDNIKIDEKFVHNLILEAKQEVLNSYKDFEILHLIVLNYRIDNNFFNQLPENLDCEKISLELIFITLPKYHLNLLKKIFGNSNIIINKLICSCYAKSIFYNKKLEYENQIGFINIDYDKTSIFYFDKKKFCNYDSIPVGSKHIESDISKILKISLSDAEEIKRNFDNENFKQKNYDIELIKKIIFSRIEEVLELSIKLFQKKNTLNSTKLIFLGEGSKILDNKFKNNIVFNHDIDLLDEEDFDVCKAGLNLMNDNEIQEVEIVSRNYQNKGIFEKFFDLFG